ncbi:MAG: baseplate J/gp47 family protein [Candidatus Dormibacteria bacterium]
MPAVVYTEASDDVTELIHRARSANDQEVALVVNAGTAGMRTPLSVRLLRQMSTSAGKSISVISGDPYIQELSRRGGLPTYASVPAFERGVQTVRPHGDDAMPLAADALGGGAAGVVAPPTAPPARRTMAAPAGGRWQSRRRPFYFAVAAVVLFGAILLLLVAPSATVKITLAGQPLSANPTIQGSTDPTAAGQADHITTVVVSSDQKQTFDAKPTGSQQLPATAATVTLHFTTTVPNGIAYLPLSKGEVFDTTDNPPIQFAITQDTDLCMGPNGAPPTGCQAGVAPNADAPAQDVTAEAKGNVAANTITKWTNNSKGYSNDPCDPSNPQHQACAGGDITVTNPQPASGGADAKTQTVATGQDVSTWNNQVTQLEQQLTGQVNSDMQGKASGKVFAKDPTGNGTSIACTATPGVPSANQPWTDTTISVDCQGSGTAYSAGDVLTDARADLQSQVPQGNVIDPTSLSCTKPAVTQAATDGTVVLSVSCTGFSEPSIDTAALRTQLSGKSPGDARNLIEHRLANVESVSITQSPLPFFWLPFFSNRIAIDTNFVPVTTGGAAPSPGASPSASP